ncbi:WXG100 family type VII secretion target [Streptomyces sp. NRRL F-5123]|uniref:WXG100 family type VII secretion target n=1 Tax=Streptomyces sp. NRRL F-5123 TaxID=1463856 RepID=UPI0004E2461E|nr:WXG100 family type VII secretion target [Streptomyces sp. NRRL F-5123]
MEHGKIVGDRFLVEQTVDGKVLWGDETENGGFISQDGTIYIDPKGKVLHGLKAPDGTFLPNGTSRVIDGHTVWGSVGDDGSFLSEDGTILVTASDHVEHGKIVGDRFLVQRTVDGKELWGSETDDGGFISQDGTIYVDAKGNVQKGITDPVSGSFIPGGIAYKMPDGSTAYGAMIGDTFFVANGTTMVLHDGTVLHGTTDWTNGIFTTGSGDSYFLGEDGVTHGSFRDVDGAFVLDGGKVVMTAKSWTVDLAQMADAITFVKSQYDLIDTYRDTISSEISKVESAWKSPAAATFTDTADNVKSALDNLYWLVGGVVDQLQQTHDNYLQAEQAANKNLSQ